MSSGSSSMPSATASPPEIVKVTGSSDGDSAKWPQAGLRPEDDTTYRMRLATKWMESRGENVKGRKFILDKLPNGYALFGKTRIKDPGHVDRYLYGHPQDKFRSAEEFFEHFRWLMGNKTGQCACVICTHGRNRKPRPPKESAQKLEAKARRNNLQKANLPKVEMPPLRQVQEWLVPHQPPTPPEEMIDEEGIPDVFRRLLDRLKDGLIVDEPITQPKSFDWVIDHGSVRSVLKDLASRPAFSPRHGELVLFIRGLQTYQSISFDASQNRFAMWDEKLGGLVELPPWEAGVVTEIPQEQVDLDDLLANDNKTYGVNYSGFRIEPMSMVGSPDKHWSKRIAHVRIHAIRPFILYREVLKSTKPKDYHPTVQHALTTMSTVSVFSPYHFKGLWPKATVFCRGIFVGAEFIMPGDVVRLMPSKHSHQAHVSDIMKVTSIKVNFPHPDVRENPDYDDPTTDVLDFDKQHDCSIEIDGIAFTCERSRALKSGETMGDQINMDLPADLKQAGDWYPMHDPSKRWKVPFSRIFGRYYDQATTESWFAVLKSKGDYPIVQGFAAINMSQDEGRPSVPARAVPPSIDKGLDAILKGRSFATQRDPRIRRDQGKAWFWANHRVEQLDLHEVKGQVTTTYFQGKPVREPGAWNRALTVRERGTAPKPRITVGPGRGRKKKVGRPSLQTGTAAEETLADVLGVDGTDSSEEMSYQSARDVIMEDVAEAVPQKEVAYIDPNQIEIASDEASSEVESEDDTDEQPRIG